MAAQTFARWSHPGVWERVSVMAHARGFQLGLTFRDCTNARSNVWNIGIKPAIRPQCREALIICPSWTFEKYNRAERLYAELKEWRAVDIHKKKILALSWTSFAISPRSSRLDNK